MYSEQIDKVISILKSNNVSMNHGMTDDEIIKAQNFHNITFPPDLKELLRTVVPVENAPKLVPLYSHRYIPSIPSEPNNPVYSVWQTDIIYCGVNIWNWFEVEFNNQKRGNMEFAEIKEVPFWGEIVS